MSSTAFSQTDTKTILLEDKVAKLIVMDLIKGDGCFKKQKANQDKIINLISKNQLKDNIISHLKFKESNNLLKIQKQEQIIGYQNNNIKALKSSLKEQKKKNRNTLIIGGTVLGVLTTLLIIN